MANYHITPNGPRVCSTTPDKCRYSEDGGPHYDNIVEAQKYHEAQLEQKHGLIATAQSSRATKSPVRGGLYSKFEKLSTRTSREARRATMLHQQLADSPLQQSREQRSSTQRGAAHESMRRHFGTGRVRSLQQRSGGALFNSLDRTPASVLKVQRLASAAA